MHKENVAQALYGGLELEEILGSTTRDTKLWDGLWQDGLQVKPNGLTLERLPWSRVIHSACTFHPCIATCTGLSRSTVANGCLKAICGAHVVLKSRRRT